MKSGLTEGKFLVYSTLAIVFLMSIHLFQQEISVIYNPKNSVGFHTLLESFSISISATIFFYGYKNFTETHSNRMLLLSFTFFLVGTLDLLHTLTFKGMPYFITESSVAKATWFWVSARVLQSMLILFLLVVKERKVKRDYRSGVLLLSAVMTIVIASVIFYFEDKLPLLVVEGEGTTLLKNSFEYFVSFIQFISLIVVLYQYYIKKSEAKLSIALALVLLLLTDLIFTIYQSVFDFDNFSGHLFKAVGFYFILRGIYLVKTPEVSDQLEVEIHQEIRKTVNFF
ncbi:MULTISPECIES: MASE3 domain-containing protein [Bacillaceae]|uniref:MASE3 domain-containing protein n=1 Tax=Bacillaceae TaxID=186817 RepID=UPI002FFDD657